jgi:peroxiredoxin
LREQGGTLLAVSVDAPEQARMVVEGNGLEFPVLCDTKRDVVRRYGVLHAGGGPRGSDIAIPAHFLIDRKGRIVWRQIARRVVARPRVADLLERIQRMAGG